MWKSRFSSRPRSGFGMDGAAHNAPGKGGAHFVRDSPAAAREQTCLDAPVSPGVGGFNL